MKITIQMTCIKVELLDWVATAKPLPYPQTTKMSADPLQYKHKIVLSTGIHELKLVADPGDFEIGKHYFVVIERASAKKPAPPEASNVIADSRDINART